GPDGRREAGPQPVPLGYPHADQLPPAVQQGGQFGPIRVGGRCRSRANDGREVGEDRRVDRGGLGVLAGPGGALPEAAGGGPRRAAGAPPVASSTTRAGASGERRATRVVIPSGSFGRRNRSPGRTATSRESFETSIPTVNGSAMGTSCIVPAVPSLANPASGAGDCSGFDRDEAGA